MCSVLLGMEAHLLRMLLLQLLLLLLGVKVLLLFSLVEGLLRLHLRWYPRCTHHAWRILEHLVWEVEGTFLVDVVCRSSLAYIYVPQAQHLIALDLDLCLSIPSRDSSAILLLLRLLLGLYAFLITCSRRATLLV